MAWKIIKKSVKILWNTVVILLLANAVWFLFVPVEFSMNTYSQTLYAKPDSPQIMGEELVFSTEVEAYVQYNAAYVTGTVTMGREVLDVSYKQSYPRSFLGYLKYELDYIGTYPWNYNGFHIAVKTADGGYVSLTGYYNRGFDTVTIYETEADYKEQKNGSTYYTAAKYRQLFGNN